MTRRASTWAVVSTAAVLVGLIAVVWLSFALADARRSDRREALQRQEELDFRQCLSRNEGREDIRQTFLAVLNGLDPDHESPAWTEGLPVRHVDGTIEKVPVEELLDRQLAPNVCLDPSKETP